MRRLQVLERLEGILRVALLPDAYEGVDEEDEQDDEGLHEGREARGALFVLLEERQHEGEAGLRTDGVVRVLMSGSGPTGQ